MGLEKDMGDPETWEARVGSWVSIPVGQKYDSPSAFMCNQRPFGQLEAEDFEFIEPIDM